MRNYTESGKGEAPVLSRRLTAIKEFVTPGYVLADIGTDHALLPVRLLLEGRIRCSGRRNIWNSITWITWRRHGFPTDFPLWNLERRIPS